jgi:putative peptide zinc metalloprotease protein
MSGATAQSDLRRNLKVRMRPDLRIEEQKYGGQTFHIVKDPVAMRYFRFRPEELFLLNRLDGRRNLEDVRQEFAEEFRPQRLSIEDLEKFVRQAMQAGIASVDTPQLGQRLFERNRKRRWDKVKQTALSFMSLKIPVFDPERILARLLPWCRWLYTLPAFFLASLFMLSALMLVAMHWGPFLEKLPTFEEFFHWKNLFWVWLATGGVKVIHEFSHGLSCKRFGGEVHEMGVMFLVFSPALYCNVTDAWMLPSKWHRAIIGAAGIYIELIMASAAVWTWWFTEPGLLHSLSLAVVVVCSISTVLFNGNPLMKFDGYYILSDLIEVPNLRERANKFLGNAASRFAFGVECQPDPFAPRKNGWAFATFAVAAYLYKWLVAIGILTFLYTFLKPYRLAILGQILACGTFFTMAIWPTYRIVKTLQQRWRQMKVKNPRMIAGLVAAAGLAGVVLFTPFPMWVDLPLILQPQGGVTVFIHEGGALKRLHVKDGDVVAPGKLLAELENPDLARDAARAALDYDRQSKRVEAGQSLGEHSLVSEAGTLRDAARETMEQVETRQEKLLLRAPAGAFGVAMTPPREKDLGTLIEPGKSFCIIGDPKRLEAYAIVSHEDTALIKVGARARIKVHGHVGEIDESTVTKISELTVSEVPRALSNQMGGVVPTQPSGQGGASEGQRPIVRSYAVTVSTPNPDARLVAGLRGTLRVDSEPRSLYWRIRRYVQQTFNFRM